MEKKPFSAIEFSKFCRNRYSMMPENFNERMFSYFLELISTCTDSATNLDSIFEEVMLSLHRFLRLNQISIALKESRSGFFKYKYFLGIRQSAINAYKKIEYSYSDLFDTKKFPRIKISDSVHFFPSEFTPYLPGEEETYNRPSKIGGQRDSIDDMLDDDYFNIFIYDHDMKCIGWVEISGTSTGKLPTRSEIRWLDHIAFILGKILSERI